MASVKNSRVYRVICTLSPTELKQFAWFLDSPFHNQRKDTAGLFTILKGIRQGQPEPSPPEIWSLIHPRAAFALPELRHLMNYLMRALEEFLSILSYRNSPAAAIQLAQSFTERGHHDLAQSQQRKTLHKIRSQEHLPATDLLYVFTLEHMQYKAHEKGKRSFRRGLQEISDSLDYWFMLQKMRLACTMLSQQKVFRAEYDLALLPAVLERARNLSVEETPLLVLYLQTYDMLDGPEPEQAYAAQIRLLNQFGHLLPAEEVRTLYLMAINFCIRQLNQGNTNFLPEVYGIYKKGLQERWLFEASQLSPWTYKNVVSAGLKLRDFQWVEDFLKEYRNHLPEGERHVFYHTNLAELQLARGDFQEVLRSLSYLQIKDPLTQLRARLAQIKAGYELREISLVESQLNNLKQLLRRKKELAYHREAYQNFERFLRRLLSLAPGNQKEKQSFFQELKDTEILAEREWLQAKARGE